MRLINAGLLLNLIVAAITGKEIAAARHQRIVATPNGYDPLSHLNDLETRDHQLLFEGPHRTYYSVNVTAEEEDQLDKTLKFVTGPINGLIGENAEIFTQASLRPTASSTIDPAKILAGIQRCKNTINNTTMRYIVFIMDGYINTQDNALSGMPILSQDNIAGSTPGVLKHGMWVAETLLGDNLNFVQPSGIEAIGLTVFDNNGNGYIFSLLTAAQKIKQQLKQLAGKGILFGATFSGDTATRNSLLDTSMAELSLVLPLTIAAGNVHAACSTISPPDAGGKVIAVGGTDTETPDVFNGWTTTVDVDYYSSWGCTPNMFYAPYCVYLNALDGTSNTHAFCGTSEATPHLHRILAYVRAACPTCTQDQAIALLKSLTTTLNSSVGPVAVFPTANVCPLDNDLIDSYRSTKGKFSDQVDGTTNEGKFCITAQVQRSSKTPRANLIFSAAGTSITVHGSNKKINNMMKKKGPTTFLFSSQNNDTDNNLELSVQTGSGFKPLFNVAVKGKANNFTLGSSSTGDVTFTNVRKCLLGA